MKGTIGSIALLLACHIAVAVQAQSLETKPSIDRPGESRVEKCLRARQVRSYEVLSDRLLLLRGRGGRYWLSRLPKACKGLHKNMAIRISRNSSRLCAHSRFQARDRTMGIEVGASASCSFGEFESLSVEQAALIRREQG